jgi:hypothetical protein
VLNFLRVDFWEMLERGGYGYFGFLKAMEQWSEGLEESVHPTSKYLRTAAEITRRISWDWASGTPDEEGTKYPEGSFVKRFFRKIFRQYLAKEYQNVNVQNDGDRRDVPRFVSPFNFAAHIDWDSPLDQEKRMICLSIAFLSEFGTAQQIEAEIKQVEALKNICRRKPFLVLESNLRDLEVLEDRLRLLQDCAKKAESDLAVNGWRFDKKSCQVKSTIDPEAPNCPKLLFNQLVGLAFDLLVEQGMPPRNTAEMRERIRQEIAADDLFTPEQLDTRNGGPIQRSLEHWRSNK